MVHTGKKREKSQLKLLEDFLKYVLQITIDVCTILYIATLITHTQIHIHAELKGGPADPDN